MLSNGLVLMVHLFIFFFYTVHGDLPICGTTNSELGLPISIINQKKNVSYTSLLANVIDAIHQLASILSRSFQLVPSGQRTSQHKHILKLK